MSLNICVATDFGIFQCSDLQLTEFSQGPSGLTARQIVAPSPKVVVLQYFDWQAVITYIGLAKLGGGSTADWLGRQLTHPSGQRSVLDVVETIRREATLAVAHLRLPWGYSPFHTFTVGVLAKDQAPQVFMISNYESLKHSPLKIPISPFFVSEKILRSQKRTLITVTGIPVTITRNDSASLERIVRNVKDATTIRRRLAEINARASRHPHSRGMISESCYVFSLFSDGTGAGESPWSCYRRAPGKHYR